MPYPHPKTCLNFLGYMYDVPVSSCANPSGIETDSLNSKLLVYRIHVSLARPGIQYLSGFYVHSNVPAKVIFTLFLDSFPLSFLSFSFSTTLFLPFIACVSLSCPLSFPSRPAPASTWLGYESNNLWRLWHSLHCLPGLLLPSGV